MRVLHITRRFRNVGGMERYLHDLCKLMHDAGCVVSVAYDEKTPEDFQIPEALTRCIPGVGTYCRQTNEAAWRALVEHVRAFRPDVVHLHDPSNPVTTRRLQDLVPTLCFVQTCGYYCLGTKFFPGSARACDRAFGPACLALAIGKACATRRPWRLARDYPRVQRELSSLQECRSLMVGSHYMRATLATNGIPSERVVVVPLYTPGVDAKTPLPVEPRLLFVGRLATGKGIELLLEALALLPGATLDVVGDGDRRDEAMALARRLGIDGRVRLHGWLEGEALAQRYALARVVVVPSVWPEPFGLVGLEAMAHGRPVVGIDRGAIPEWLEHEETGLLVGADRESLAAAVRRLLTEPDLAERMGARARQRCRERFSPAAHWEQLRCAYEWTTRRPDDETTRGNGDGLSHSSSRRLVVSSSPHPPERACACRECRGIDD